MIKILYDGTILINGNKNNTGRTGIFVTADSILKNMLTDERIKVDLYCVLPLKSELKKFLREFSEYKNINIVSLKESSFIYDLYIKLKQKKDNYRIQKKVFKLLLIKFVLLFMTVLKNFSKYRMVKYNNRILSSYDVYFSPKYCVPKVIQQYSKIQKYVLLYDAIPVIFNKYVDWYNELVVSLNETDFYFSISNNTKKDFLRYFPKLSEEQFLVTPLAVSSKFYKIKDKKKLLLVKEKYGIPRNGKYVLSVGTIESRKNVLRGFRCFIEFIKKHKIENCYYVLSGAERRDYKSKLERVLSRLGNARKNIIQTGYVDDEDLPTLYSGAEWFVYTSQYEGFGLPPLEAMACGCPVITSNNSSLPEVVGDAGIMIDWDSDEQHIRAYEKYYFDKKFRDKMAQKGLERAKQFSWEKSVKSICNHIVKDISKYREPIEIALITDDNYVPQTITLIESLLKNKEEQTEYSIHIVCSSLSTENILLLSKYNVELVYVKDEFEQFNHTHLYVSSAALFKFNLPKIFKNYDKILYLDVDMIVQKDLTPLYNIQLRDAYAAVVQDIQCVLSNKDHRRNKLRYYFNSGMMLLNLKKMREDDISSKLIDYKLNFPEGKYMDQDAFNCIFSENIILLSPTYNYIPYSWRKYSREKIMSFFHITKEEYKLLASNKADIIHYAGKDKVWKKKYMSGSDIWAKYYYQTPLKDHKIQYIDVCKWKLFGLSHAESWKKFYFFGIPLLKENFIDNRKILFCLGFQICCKECELISVSFLNIICFLKEETTNSRSIKLFNLPVWSKTFSTEKIVKKYIFGFFLKEKSENYIKYFIFGKEVYSLYDAEVYKERRFCGIKHTTISKKSLLNIKRSVDIQRCEINTLILENQCIDGKLMFGTCGSNAILIVEVNPVHGEVLPSFIKYFYELGFSVDLLLDTNHEIMQDLVCVNKYLYRVVYASEPVIRMLLQSDLLHKYKYILFNSNTLYRIKGTTMPGWPNIYEFFYNKINMPENKVISIEHRMELLHKAHRNKLVVISDIQYPSDKKTTSAFVTYAGDIFEPHLLNLRRTFVVVGAVENVRKNHALLFGTVRKLVAEKIENFKVVVIGKGAKPELAKDIENFVDFKGELTYPEMYKIINNSDFILGLLDPDNVDHDRYITTGTRGTFGLAYSFAKPIILANKFSRVHYFTTENSILYDTNDNFFDAIKQAIFITNQEYEKKCNEMKKLQEKLRKRSLDNLQEMLVDDKVLL